VHVLFMKIDELNNAFVPDGRVDGVHETAFKAMAKECAATPDEAHDIVADLYDSNGNLFDVVTMTRQMRVRAQRTLEHWK
jgi:hypothetical protein